MTNHLEELRWKVGSGLRSRALKADTCMFKSQAWYFLAVWLQLCSHVFKVWWIYSMRWWRGNEQIRHAKHWKSKFSISIFYSDKQHCIFLVKHAGCGIKHPWYGLNLAIYNLCDCRNSYSSPLTICELINEVSRVWYLIRLWKCM